MGEVPENSEKNRIEEIEGVNDIFIELQFGFLLLLKEKENRK